MNMNPILVAAIAVAAFLVLNRFLKGGKVSQNVVQEMIKSGAQIVDVRSSEEYRDGYYTGAVNIPVQDLARRMGELKKDRPVVLYCASGARSGMAARLLKQAGFTRVVNAGGLGDMPA